MHTNDPGRQIPIWNSGCAAFLCTLFAAVLFESCGAALGMGPLARTLGLLGLGAQAFAVRRAALPCRARARAAAPELATPRPTRLLARTDLAAALFLAALGFAGAFSLRFGVVGVVAVFAVFLCVFPWSRIRMCRRGACVPGLMLVLGAAGALLAQRPFENPMLLAIAAWIVWVAAAGAWVRLLVLKQRAARASAGFSASA